MQHVRKAAPSIFGFALLLAGAAGSFAQGLPGGASSLNEAHGDWAVVCTTPEGAVHCSMSQTHVSGENGQRVLAVELRIAAGGGVDGLLVMPFGLRLADGVRLAVDEGAPLPVQAFSTCLPAGCLVPLSFAADTVAAFRNGTALGLKATANDTGQEVAFSISLRGFTSALARLSELLGA